ncbi:MAG TPA: tRNA (adenosine(37)-N6)-threonylcarbamoyltransferase complex ATPase subunit type 1 TsaE [Steroidobacteraceae bacterium]
MTIELALADSEHTERLGAAIARCGPRSAKEPLIVYLQGELGAGKTTLARGLLRELGVTGVVRSPSYTLLESYESGGLRVLHLDLYRLDGAQDLAALGWRDEWTAGALFLVEWPERATGALPPADLQLRLSIAGQGRHARIDAATAAGTAWLDSLRGEPAIAEMNRV